MKRWINTKVISEWNEETQRYETVSSEGYWYDGNIDYALDCGLSGISIETNSYNFYIRINCSAETAQFEDDVYQVGRVVCNNSTGGNADCFTSENVETLCMLDTTSFSGGCTNKISESHCSSITGVSSVICKCDSVGGCVEYCEYKNISECNASTECDIFTDPTDPAI